jgi:hypothetical protein
MWPAFVAFTIADGLLLHSLPVAGDGIDLVPALLLCGFLNLAVVAVAAPLAGRLLRRRRGDLPKVVAVDYAGTALVAAVAAGLLVAGLVHRPVVQRAQRDEHAQARAAAGFIQAHGTPAVRARLSQADTVKLSDRFYRTCVPDGRPRRAFCVFVRTNRDPPSVRRDPDGTPNAQYRTVVP